MFAGCSFTAGNGWNDQAHPNLWVNLAHKNIPKLQNLQLINIGQGGASNTEIFENVINAIDPTVEYLFCQWTAMPRYNFQVGFELWPTHDHLSSGPTGRNNTGIDLNKGNSYSREYLNDLLDRLLVLHHLHYEILKVVKYSSIIAKLAKHFGIQVAFINGLCPWDDNYFERLNNVLPESYTPFTKTEILNIETRSDEDIFKLYKQLHDDYDTAGGVDPTKWINLYSSMQKNKIDTNSDNLHPGIQSNQLYYNQLKEFLGN